MEKSTALKLFNLTEEELTQDSINRAYERLVGTINNDVLDDARLVLLEETLDVSRGTTNLASISNQLDEAKRDLNNFSEGLEESLNEANRIVNDIKELKERIEQLEKQKVEIANNINNANDSIYRLQNNIDELEIQKQILADKEDKKNRKNRIEELNNDIKVLNQELEKIYEQMGTATVEDFDDLKRQREAVISLIEDHKRELASLEYAPKKTIYKKKVIKKVKKKDKILTEDEMKNDHPIKVNEVEDVQNVDELRNKDEIKELFAPQAEISNAELNTSIFDNNNIDDMVQNIDMADSNIPTGEIRFDGNEEEAYKEKYGNIELSYPNSLVDDQVESEQQFEQPIFDANAQVPDDSLVVDKGNFELNIPTDKVSNEEQVITSDNEVEQSIISSEPDYSKEITFEEEPSLNIDAELINDVNANEPVMEEASNVQEESVQEPSLEKPKADDLNFSGIQVTKTFINDMQNNENGFEVKQDTVDVVKKPMGFMGKLKQKFNSIVHGKSIQESKDNLKKVMEEVYLDNLKIQKVNNEMAALDKFSPQIVDYEKLLAKLYAGKKGRIEYIEFLESILDKFNDIYPNIKDETFNSIVASLPSDVEYDVGAAITEVVNSNESNSYSDDDVSMLDDFVRTVNEVKGLSSGMSR